MKKSLNSVAFADVTIGMKVVGIQNKPGTVIAKHPEDQSLDIEWHGQYSAFHAVIHLINAVVTVSHFEIGEKIKLKKETKVPWNKHHTPLLNESSVYLVLSHVGPEQIRVYELGNSGQQDAVKSHKYTFPMDWFEDA